MLAPYARELTRENIALVASTTGLHPDILRMLVRDGILPGHLPTPYSADEGCDLDEAQAIADQLNAARAPVEGQEITATDAGEKYNFNRKNIYIWHKNGWITTLGTGNYNAQLFNEGDIAFARALADLRGQAAGKAVFPAKPRSGRPRKK
jgi:hypothetical protein